MNPHPDESAMAAIDKARSHPLRRRILGTMMEVEDPLSPKQLHRFIAGDTTLADVSYHCRTLESLGVIDLVDQGQVRGAVVHYYARSKAFTADIADGVALDRIAEELDALAGTCTTEEILVLARIVGSTGRPVIFASMGGES